MSTYCKIVTDNLDGGAGGEAGPRRPVVLVEGILNGHHGEVLDEFQVDFSQLLRGQVVCRVGLGVLEVQIISAVLEEL